MEGEEPNGSRFLLVSLGSVLLAHLSRGCLQVERLLMKLVLAGVMPASMIWSAMEGRGAEYWERVRGKSLVGGH